MTDLLDQGVGAGFHIADALRQAASAEARAVIVLQLPDLVLSTMFGAIDGACFDSGFELGRRYIALRQAAFSARRGGDGQLPADTQAQLEHWRGLVVSLAGRGQ